MAGSHQGDWEVLGGEGKGGEGDWGKGGRRHPTPDRHTTARFCGGRGGGEFQRQPDFFGVLQGKDKCQK